MTARIIIDILILLSLLVTGFIYVRAKVIEYKNKYNSNSEKMKTDVTGKIDKLWESINGHYSTHNMPIEAIKKEIKDKYTYIDKVRDQVIELEKRLEVLEKKISPGGRQLSDRNLL
jgi:RNAse (barnase) inhibitor barstar